MSTPSSDGYSDPDSASTPITAPFGSWRSPITSRSLVEGQIRLGQLCLDGKVLYWTESRPEEKGRHAIVRRDEDGAVEDVLPLPFNARSTVHEYGGGAMLVSGGTVYFSNFEDQRIWRIVPGNEPEPLTSEGALRFADYIHDAGRNRLICVCEDHRQSDQEPVNRVVAVDLDDGQITSLCEGADFYSTPRMSPDGRQLAWLSWNHPNMPWDGTELFVSQFDERGRLTTPHHIAGGSEESIFQPQWAPDGTLYFVSDRNNWWNLYCVRDNQQVPVLPMEAEFGVAHWTFGLATYDFEPSGKIVARYTQAGQWRLVRIDTSQGEVQDLPLVAWNVSDLCVSDDQVYAVVSSPSEPATLVKLGVTGGGSQTIRRSSPAAPEPGYTSIPEAIEYPTDYGDTAHAWYYAPANHDYSPPAGEAPPLLVLVHGGPTSATTAEFRAGIQYWTSRGFGVCDVNYGGSTGYGRQYRNRLRDRWGVVDVADATNAAIYLAEQGRVDGQRLIIRGGSAGGYTTLACLAFRDAFCCGSSHYGVSDLSLLARETHKFESRYLDRLVAPYPEEEQRYRDRSPVYHLERFDRPVILLQGLEDKVVPPNQAEMIFDELREKGIPVAYVPFVGEQHGFRQADSIIRAHESELYFFSRILGFPLSDPVEPIEICNLPGEDASLH